MLQSSTKRTGCAQFRYSIRSSAKKNCLVPPKTQNNIFIDTTLRSTDAVTFPMARSSLAFFFTPNYDALLEWPPADSPNRWEVVRSGIEELKEKGKGKGEGEGERIHAHTVCDDNLQSNNARTYAQWRKDHIRKALDNMKKQKTKQK